MFGHPNSQVLAATAAKYVFYTKNDLHLCSNCAISKARQKNLHNLTAHPSTELGGRIIINFQCPETPVMEELIFGF
jgi:hypothetical protein